MLAITTSTIPQSLTNIASTERMIANKTVKGFIFDATGKAIVSLKGPDGQDLLQRISTNDLSKLTVGETVQTILTNEKGRIIEVVAVIKLAEQKLLLVGQSSGDKLLRWVEKFIIMEDANVESKDGVYKHFVLYGLSEDMERQLKTEKELLNDAIIFKESWQSVTLINLLVEHLAAKGLLQHLENASCVLTNKGDFDRFRIQNHIPSSLTELTEEYNPLEANLNHFISWTKGCYIGQEVIARLDTYKKVQRQLVGLQLQEMPASVPKAIFNESEEIGILTSAVAIEKSSFAGLGYIKRNYLESNGSFFIKNDGKQISVTLQKEQLQ